MKGESGSVANGPPGWNSPAGPAARLAAVLAGAVPRDARVLLAVSGGSDSMALLALAAPLLAGRVAVVHVDHGLRPTSAREADLVASVSRSLGLACEVLRAGPGPGRPGRSETAARGRRLAALADAARSLGAGCVLLGHHADDDLETIVLRHQRGHAGLRARAGMPGLRPLAPGVRLLRPFLAGTRPPGRSELAGAREAAGLPHVEDESNRDLAVPRNAVRARLASGGQDTRERLLALRSTARADLARTLALAASRLETHFRAQGLGSVLAAGALAPAPGIAAASLQAEMLRLLGRSLARPRDIAPRAAGLQELALRLVTGGPLVLGSACDPCRLQVRHGALQLPDEPPRAVPADVRALGALLDLPLPLP